MVTIRYLFNGKVLEQKLLDCSAKSGVVQVPELDDLTLYVEKSKEDSLNRSSYVKCYCAQSPVHDVMSTPKSIRTPKYAQLSAQNDFSIDMLSTKPEESRFKLERPAVV